MFRPNTGTAYWLVPTEKLAIASILLCGARTGASAARTPCVGKVSRYVRVALPPVRVCAVKPHANTRSSCPLSVTIRPPRHSHVTTCPATSPMASAAASTGGFFPPNTGSQYWAVCGQTLVQAGYRWCGQSHQTEFRFGGPCLRRVQLLEPHLDLRSKISARGQSISLIREPSRWFQHRNKIVFCRT